MLTTRASAADFPASKSASNWSKAAGRAGTTLEDIGEDSLLFAPHVRAYAVLAFFMIVAQRMQRSVHDDPCELLAHPDTIVGRVLPNAIGTDIDVTDDG